MAGSTVISQATIRRMIRAAREEGLNVSAIEGRPDGSVLVVTGAKVEGLSPLEQWRFDQGRTLKKDEPPMPGTRS